MQKTTAEYRAGLFDGEGSVTFVIQRYGPDTHKYMPRSWEAAIRPMLSMGNTQLELLELMKDAYGGRIVKNKKLPGRKQCWTWTLRKAPDIQAACADLVKHSIGKVQRIGIMLVMIRTYRRDRGVKPLTMDERRIRRQCYHQIRSLNVRGDGVYR